MPKKQQPECTIESEGLSLFVVFDGVRIAKRGEPGTPQAGRGCPWSRATRCPAAPLSKTPGRDPQGRLVSMSSGCCPTGSRT